MIALFMSWGLSRAWSWVAAIGLPILLVVAVLLALDAWGDSRYRAGKAAEHAAWVAASDKLLKDAAAAGANADKAALGRAVDFAAKQEEERNRIDAAIEAGASPVDVLFPVDNGVRP